MANEIYCVVFRTGGTQNFKWKRSLGMSHIEAIAKANELKGQGFKALVENFKNSLSIGLPETF